MGIFKPRILIFYGDYFWDVFDNGFLKKSANTPRKELQKAFRIRKEYYINVIDSN